MTNKKIQSWFACQMPGASGAWEAILFARVQGQDYLFEFELRDIFESYPQSNFAPTFEVFLNSAGLEVTTENIPPFGDVQIIYINTLYVYQVGAALSEPDFDNVCAVWGFNGTAFPNG